MKISETNLRGVYSIEADNFHDERGSFIKTFHKDTFLKNGLNVNYEESFYSISKKDVIRGMHFQIPPADHSKLVYVTSGKILDVVLDIRRNSPTYGQYISIELSAQNNLLIYIPTGCAHGFISLEDNSCTVYLQSTMRSAEHEGGILFNSFGMNWNTDSPILSKRDMTFPTLEKFETPFIYDNHENIN